MNILRPLTTDKVKLIVVKGFVCLVALASTGLLKISADQDQKIMIPSLPSKKSSRCTLNLNFKQNNS